MNPICHVCKKAIYDQPVQLHEKCDNYRLTVDPSNASSLQAYHNEYLAGLSVSELLWFIETSLKHLKDKAIKIELPEA